MKFLIKLFETIPGIVANLFDILNILKGNSYNSNESLDKFYPGGGLK